ncbi:hypothetical protein AB0F46_35305 [Streptomyces sp. NPDC026665]|uniref:hypothetical protein n=1 Tax=Streptomyces sp. NPDC026665 TaxID=3154798 RepID=UPI0033CF5D41
MTDPAHDQAAQVLAAHIDHLIVGLRDNAATGFPEDRPGMERATELLGLHRAKLLTGDQAVVLLPLLYSLASGISAQAAVENAHALARRWGMLRAYGGAATELRAALTGRGPLLPAGFTRISMISVSCTCCGYTYDEDEAHTLLFDSDGEATRAVKAAGWTVLAGGRVLCTAEDDDHEQLRTPANSEPSVPVSEGQQELTAAVNNSLASRSR